MAFVTIILLVLIVVNISYILNLVLIEYLSVLLIFYYINSNMCDASLSFYIVCFVLVFEGILFSALMITN